MTRRLLLLGIAVLVSGCQEPGPGSTGDGRVVTKVGLSPLLHIDRKYRSMEGPSAETRFRLGSGEPELLWVTGYRTEVVDADGEPSEELAEFMCHNNLDFDSGLHRDRFGLERHVNFGRMFTISQGVLAIDLPEGYGIPVFSDEELTVNTMVLNHNHEELDLQVRHRISVDYVTDAVARGWLKPLYPSFGPVMALLSGADGYYGLEETPDEHLKGASCAPGLVAPNAPEGTRHYRDGEGRHFTQHWVVPPGREVRRTLVTEILNFPFDTTIHFIAAHLHPYARSLELRDLDADETLFRAKAHPPLQGVGLARVDHYSSPEGIPVFRDRDYELVSVYENPTGTEQDAMAVFFVYYYDAELDARLEEIRESLARERAGGRS